MTENQDKINQLLSKLDELTKRQELFSQEVNNLRAEINLLRSSEAQDQIEVPAVAPIVSPPVAPPPQQQPLPQAQIKPPVPSRHQKKQKPPKVKKPKSNFSLEKFIGGNLISIIGIIITVLGVSFGAKYVIEHKMISPLTRIILGYIAGLILLLLAFKLKKKYKNYSAVLLSGSMAIMYFITFLAYVLYNLFPQTFAFALMVVFTVFTVIAALNYNRQIIAHIGLVGAYAIPFLLSNNSGRVDILFSYMAIINVGILIISIKKYWKPLFYSSFGLTWIIYALWFGSAYKTSEHFYIAMIFLSIFFGIFYLTFLVNKLIQKEKFDLGDIILLLANSFIFFGFGLAIISDHRLGDELLGLFTLCNAILHFIVSLIINKQKLVDRNLFYLVSGLVLVFVTITFPIQFDGNWVTLLWVGEAALLFWIGRTKKISIYEYLSYAMMLLAFGSIVHDWLITYFDYSPYNEYPNITPIFNINFLTALIFVSAFGFIYWLNRNSKFITPEESSKALYSLVSILISSIFLIGLYFAFRNEIAIYFRQLYANSFIETTMGEGEYSWIDTMRDYDIRKFQSVWIINYTLLFFTALTFVNIKKIKNQVFGIITLSLSTITILVLLTQGLLLLSELRESYLWQEMEEYYHRGIFNLLFRYISIVLGAGLLITTYQYTKQAFMKVKFRMWINFMIHISVVWIASSELINILDIVGFQDVYKLGLSILWGVYCLFLISLGIWKRKMYLRIAAMSFFGITLIKLFFYDLSHLNTISKTIVLVSLGALLLMISFLYNKYKHIIFEDHETHS